MDIELRDLLTEYRTVIGAMELAELDEESLRGLGAEDPAAVQRASRVAIEEHGREAREKEADILEEFEEAYEDARSDHAGLRELDVWRRYFLTLQFRARGADRRARERTLAEFERIDRTLSMDNMSAEEIREMDQWEEIDDYLDDLNEEMPLAAEEYDWEEIDKLRGRLEQMFWGD